MRISLGTLLLGSSLACLAGPAVGQTGAPIGSTVLVVNRVTAELAREARTLRIGDDVRQDEVIEVAPNGRGELKLNDETKLALGPGSRMLLDKFVYDAQQTNGSIIMNLVKGTFRFITGIATKPSYLIRVPNASITVRGTIFDLNILDNGEVWALLIEGALEACVDGGACRVLDQPGMIVRISGGNVGQPTRWTSLPRRRNASFDQAFPFVTQAPQVDPVPIFTREAILLGRFPQRPRQPGGTHDTGRYPSQKTDSTPSKTKAARVLTPPKQVKVTKKVVIKRTPAMKRTTVIKRTQVKRITIPSGRRR